MTTARFFIAVFSSTSSCFDLPFAIYKSKSFAWKFVKKIVIVNLSARLMQAAAPGEILVDYNTSFHAQDDTDFVDFVTLPPLKVKGKSEPIDVYARLQPVRYFYTTFN